MSTSSSSASRASRWGGLSVATGAAILGLKLADAIGPGTAYLLAIIPLVLLFLCYRASLDAANSGAGASRAAARYTIGIMASSLAYMLGLGVAMWVWRNLEPSTELTWLLAMLPIIPIFWMIFVMGRYVAEETDEYLRHRAIMASLVGLGFVLAIGSFWGFLETFELVPHVPGWWSVPIWALGMGVGQFWQSRRGA
ncbi:MAG: hypothetical protein R3E14_06015 [Erythrobacter sp.]